jgi:hypothetical protein
MKLPACKKRKQWLCRKKISRYPTKQAESALRSLPLW